jgi:hypothetical protein
MSDYISRMASLSTERHEGREKGYRLAITDMESLKDFAKDFGDVTVQIAIQKLVRELTEAADDSGGVLYHRARRARGEPVTLRRYDGVVLAN